MNKRSLSSVSLLWKILFSTSIAITLLFAGIGWIVQDQFVRIASAGIEDEVHASFQAYDSLWQARAHELASVSLVLSRMSDVRSAFSTGDQATIRDTAGEIWDKISRRGALFLVTDPRGGVLAALGRGAVSAKRDVPAVRAAASRFPSQVTGFVVQDGRLYQIVITPVYVAAAHGSALLNVLVAGFGVDADLAKELQAATGGSEFAFSVQGQVIASTLSADGVRAVEAEAAGTIRQRLMIGQVEYAQFATPLLDIEGKPLGQLRILRSFEGARNRIASVRNNIAMVWAVAVLAGLGLTYLLARRLLEPVKALDLAAAEIGRGNFDTRVQVTSDDEIGRLAGTFNDMCESIHGAREELIRQERISTIGRLSTSIIHDLRNPLASIYGGSEMLVDDELTKPQVKRLATNIYRSSRRVQELLQELADVTRGESHAREVCRLRDVIEDGCETLIPLADARQVTVEFSVPEQIEIPLDRSPMQRVFQNLVANAIEAMPEGGSVRVSAEAQGTGVLVTVQDTGPGIPAAIAGQLFQPFVTSGKKNGTGLGLALSRKTVLDHGGDLWADSKSPGGARFFVRLPG
ncbi:MAG: ATP-binding protein [Bryobacteraceae bacterium]